MNKNIKNPLIIAFILISTGICAQINNKTGWQEQALLNKPSKVKMIVYDIVEKFGELTEVQKGTEDLTFNSRGYYLSTKTENLNPEGRKKQISYYYEAGADKLIKIEIHGGDYPQGWEWTLINEYDYSSDNLVKFITVPECYENYRTCKEEYEYDAQKRNTGITFYDKSNDVNLVEKYLYKGLLLTDRKTYDGLGKLKESKQLFYNAKGLLIRTDNHSRISGEVFIDNNSVIEYNTKNDTIKKIECSRPIWYAKPMTCQDKIYVYEYYSNGLVKKITNYKIYHVNGESHRDKYEHWEFYKYDTFNNWIEKTIWEYDSKTNMMSPSLKYVREIEYFD